EDEKIQSGNQAIGHVAGDEVDLMILESAGEQAKFHDARRTAEAQAIGGSEALVAVGALHKFVTESGAPLPGLRGGLRKRLQMQAASVVAADFDGKGVVESERRTEGQVEALFVTGLHAIENSFPVRGGLLLEDR